MQNASRHASTSTHSARMSFTSTRPKLHQICFPCHGISSAMSITPPLLRHRQTIHEGCTRTLSGSSNACALLVVVAIVLQIFASQIHRRGEVGRGRGGKLSHQAPKPDGTEWIAAQWGCAPQVGNATLGGPNAQWKQKLKLHNTQTTDRFVSWFTLHRGYRTINLDNVTYQM